MGNSSKTTDDELDFVLSLDLDAAWMEDFHLSPPSPPANTAAASRHGAREDRALSCKTHDHGGIHRNALSFDMSHTTVTMSSTVGCEDLAAGVATEDSSWMAGGVAAQDSSSMEEDKEPFEPAEHAPPQDLLLNFGDLSPTQEVNNLKGFDFDRVADSSHDDPVLAALVSAAAKDPAFWENFEEFDFDHVVGGSGEDSKGVNAAVSGRRTSDLTQGAGRLPSPPVATPAWTLEEVRRKAASSTGVTTMTPVDATGSRSRQDPRLLRPIPLPLKTLLPAHKVPSIKNTQKRCSVSPIVRPHNPMVPFIVRPAKIQKPGTKTGECTAVNPVSPGTPHCKPKLPPLSKRCTHGSCTKYKQTGCYGYCASHAKLYDDPSARMYLARRARFDTPVKTGVIHWKMDAVATVEPPAATTKTFLPAESPMCYEVNPAKKPTAPTASAAAVSPTLAAVVSPATTDPTLLPPLGKRCNHGSCTKYKQTGCHGYCVTHAKLYDDPSARGRLARRAPVDARVKTGVVCLRTDAVVMAEPPAAMAKALLSDKTPACHEVNPAKKAPALPTTKSAVNPNLSALVSAATADPTLWKSPTFAAAMAAVAAQMAAKSPA